jgi:hypothetical protein
VVTVSYWLWLAAAGVAVVAVVLALTRLDAIRAGLGRVVRDSDPSATADTVDRVVHASVLVIVIGGLVLGVAGGLFALGLRVRRKWARIMLTVVAVLSAAYGWLVVSATGWLVVAYAVLSVAAAVWMYLPGARRWFG